LLRLFVASALLISGARGFCGPQERIRGTNRHYRPGDWTTWSSMRHIRHLCIAPDRIYFATTGGIACFNPFSQLWEEPYTVSNGLASADIKLVAFDEDSGFLWCTQEEGLSYLGPASGVWTNLFYDEMGFGTSERIVALGFGDDYHVYLKTDKGRSLAAYGTSGQFDWDQAPGTGVRVRWFGESAPAEPPPPYLYLPQGYWYHQTERTISDSHNRSFPLTCWQRDPWNTLWIATWGLGAARVDLLTAQYQPLPFGLWNDGAEVFAYDREALWIGGEPENEGDGGLTRWEIGRSNPDYFEPRYLPGFSDERITAMAFDEDILWFGTRNGLTRYDVNRQSWRTLSQVDHLPDPRITHLYLDDDYLWVASEAGLARILKASARKRDSLSVEIIDVRRLGRLYISFLAPQGDTLWVGTELGLYWYNTVRDTGDFYSEGFFPAGQAIHALACKGAEVWFGTAQGIAGFNARSGEWFAPPAQRLEPCGEIYWMEADDHSVWVAGQRGVLRYDREGLRWIHYSMEDGLPAKAVHSLMLAGDYIWFGSSGGLTLFYWNAPYRID
jgi:ligand-binding sensor domain-containing protein